MKVQDAIRIDEERGGRGRAVLPDGTVAYVTNDEHYLFLVFPDHHSRVDEIQDLPLLQRADWEPVTPEPVCEWEVWRIGLCYPVLTYESATCGSSVPPEELVRMTMPDGSPRFGGWVWLDEEGHVIEIRMATHVLWGHGRKALTDWPNPSTPGGPVFAAHARMRTLPKGGGSDAE